MQNQVLNIERRPVHHVYNRCYSNWVFLDDSFLPYWEPVWIFHLCLVLVKANDRRFLEGDDRLGEEGDSHWTEEVETAPRGGFLVSFSSSPGSSFTSADLIVK